MKIDLLGSIILLYFFNNREKIFVPAPVQFMNDTEAVPSMYDYFQKR